MAEDILIREHKWISSPNPDTWDTCHYCGVIFESDLGLIIPQCIERPDTTFSNGLSEKGYAYWVRFRGWKYDENLSYSANSTFKGRKAERKESEPYIHWYSKPFTNEQKTSVQMMEEFRIAFEN